MRDILQEDMRMKRKNRILGSLGALLFGMMITAASVSADTISYNWTFTSTRPTKFATPGFKNDSEQNYYITISSGNISASNVFGASIRDLNTEAYMARYRTHVSLKYSVPYGYDQGRYANTEEPYQMRGKKDDSSTSSANLTVSGKITY